MKYLYALFTALSASLLSGDIVIAGSDLLDEVVRVPMEVFTENTGVRVRVAMQGSLPAERDFEAGKVDLMIVAEPSGEYNADSGVVAKRLAFLVAVVAGHSESPIDEISAEQLQRIYAEDISTLAERWSDLGVQGLNASGTIRPYLYAQQNSVLIELFRATALDRRKIRGTVERERSLPTLVEMISADPNALAILPRAPQASGTKVLRVAGGEDAEFAFDPDADNVYFGSYPLRLAFYVVYRQERGPVLEEIIGLLYGDDFTALLQENDFVALPPNLRQRTLLEVTSANPQLP